ncbi:MAG: Ig-like domain-containing protein, partial [Anaerolineae bacterium]|nr:Ig-like domain-containing protein [Anaerolineae bacterium]
MNKNTDIRLNPSRWAIIFTFVLLISAACALPSMLPWGNKSDDNPTTTPPPPTATPAPLPPELVEVQPPAGSRLPLDGILKFYFNQPMNQASVENVLHSVVISENGDSQPLAGNVAWLDESSMTFSPSSSLRPLSDVIWELGPGAQAANGLSLDETITVKFKTASPLEVVQMLPGDGLSDISPESAIVVGFNQPVVALGANPASLPLGLTLSPEVEGHGEWVNTSTYIFYPDMPLPGGRTFSVSVRAQLKSTMGVRLNAIPDWTFSTANPRVVSTSPEIYEVINLDSSFEIIFNQPMDRSSVEENFIVAADNNFEVLGTFEWSDDSKKLIFSPDDILTRDMTYRLILGEGSQAYGGTRLDEDVLIPFSTVPVLQVISHSWNSTSYGSMQSRGSIIFNGPILDDDPEPYISVIPEVADIEYNWYGWTKELNMRGDFKPLTRYQISVAAGLPDPWDGETIAPYRFEFTTSALRSGIHIGRNDIIYAASDSKLAAKVTNVARAQANLGEIPLDYFMVLGGTSYGVDAFNAERRQTWPLELGLQGDRFYNIDLSLTPDGSLATPGIYQLEFDLTPKTNVPESDTNVSRKGPYVIIVSDVNLVFKIAHDKIFVWAVSLKNGLPIADAEIKIYDKDGQLLISGRTNFKGVFQTDTKLEQSFYDPYYAVLARPGDSSFALTRSTWDTTISPYQFGISRNYSAPDIDSYIYTDRPIYRPGQTVSYRAITRYSENGRYQIDTSLDTLPVTIFDGDRNILFEGNQPVSTFGTSHGSFTLADDAQPGNYQIQTPYGNLLFDVAEYRKPEINLQIEAQAEGGEILSDSTQTIDISARYFFDAPAGDQNIVWNLYREEARFHIPGYQTGPQNFCWYCSWYERDYFGELIDSGDGVSDAQGKLAIKVDIQSEEAKALYTLEATMIDESGYPVSGRQTLNIHPESYYIGAKADSWLGQTGEEMDFEVLTVDWELNP